MSGEAREYFLEAFRFVSIRWINTKSYLPGEFDSRKLIPIPNSFLILMNVNNSAQNCSVFLYKKNLLKLISGEGGAASRLLGKGDVGHESLRITLTQRIFSIVV